MLYLFITIRYESWSITWARIAVAGESYNFRAYIELVV